MKRELIVKTCSLAGTSDLTIMAPIRQGLVPSLDSVTYKSRVKRVLRALHAGRSAAHEGELIMCSVMRWNGWAASTRCASRCWNRRTRCCWR